MTPQLVRTTGDGLGQRLRPTDEQRRKLHRDLGIVERALCTRVRAQVVDQVGRPVAAGDTPFGNEIDEVRVQLRVGRLAGVADTGDVGITLHERVDPRDEQLGVVDREPELQRGHLCRDRRRVVVTHVEGGAVGQRVEAGACQLAHCGFERRDRARAERPEQRLAELGVRGRVEHRERRERARRGGDGRPVVMMQQRLAMEHRTFEDREAVAVGEHLPHVVEARERVRVVYRQRHDPVTGAQLAVHGVRVGHHVDGERVVRHIGPHERRR